MKCLLIFLSVILISIKGECQYWKALGGGVQGGGLVEALLSDTIHHKLYAGGVFNIIGNVSADYMAWWDGSEWHHFPVQPSDPVVSFAMKEDTMIFVTANSNDFQVGRYVDTVFIDTLPKFSNVAYCLYVFHDTLYAGGEFSGGIKYWNGTTWKKLGGGVSGSEGAVYCIGSYGDQLIVGGHFSSAGGVSVNNIAAWNGNEWSDMGGGMTNQFTTPYVYTMEQYNGKLYVGGDFDHSGGVHTGSIAMWDGTVWDTVLLSTFGTSCGVFYDFQTDDSLFYVTGSISGGVGCMGDLAGEYDGHNWFNMHLGVGNAGLAITVFDGDVISGSENKFGYNGDTINYIAKFLGYPTEVSSTINNGSQLISPNPASTSIQIHLPSNQQTTLIIFNLIGEKLREEKISGNKISIDVSDLPAGMYVARTEKEVIGKFVKEE